MKRLVFSLIGLMVFCVPSWGDDMIKEPNVSGVFYSADPQELSSSIDAYKQAAGSVLDNRKILIAIAPHAGYPYSGPVAAYTFKAIARNHYKTVVIIGPSHFHNFEGISVWKAGGFRTPLGILPVDEAFASALLKTNPDEFKFLPDVFSPEHSVEVELPFLQKTFKDIHIVPIVMGNPDPQVCHDLAVALDKLIDHRDDILVLISSDMSHYLPYDENNDRDARTLQAIQAMDPKKFFEGCISRKMEMCGFVPVTTALILARLRGLDHAEILKHANSGDSSGDKSRVVGYGAIIFYAQTQALNALEKKELLTMARATLETFVKTGNKYTLTTQDPRLGVVQGAFVTLRKHGALRGCIGNVIGQNPLDQTVRDMTIAAASEDPRFNPVTADELKDIDLEISVLSPPRHVKELAEIVLGKHGVIVSDGLHQGVFLPQVASETGWSKEEFLSELCSQKAGLPSDCWKDPKISLSVFTADVFAEEK